MCQVQALKVANALIDVNHAAREYVRNNDESSVHWFPCGFVTLTYKCRKNATEAKALQDFGFRWDDYYKRYKLSAHHFTNSQSMHYQEDIMNAAALAAERLGVIFTVESRMD